MFPSKYPPLYHLCQLNCPSPDIIALGFQEIVPLSAQQIVQTDPEKKYVDVKFSLDVY